MDKYNKSIVELFLLHVKTDKTAIVNQCDIEEYVYKYAAKNNISKKENLLLLEEKSEGDNKNWKSFLLGWANQKD